MSVGVAIDTAMVPGNLTRVQMQKIILSYVQALQDDPELNELANMSIRSGISSINERNWKKLAAFHDIGLTATDAEYELPTDYKDPLHCELLGTGGRPNGRLHYKELKRLLREHPVSDQDGAPSVYTIMYDQRLFRLEPAPAASFTALHPTARARYFRRVPFPSEGDGTGLPPEFDWWLIWNGRSEIAAIRRPQVYGLAAGEAGRRWRQLKIDDNAVTDWSEC
jgi:hypothetical protein